MSDIDGFVMPVPKRNREAMNDPRMQIEGEYPFAGIRLIYGGFTLILDTSTEQ